MAGWVGFLCFFYFFNIFPLVFFYGFSTVVLCFLWVSRVLLWFFQPKKKYSKLLSNNCEVDVFSPKKGIMFKKWV